MRSRLAEILTLAVALRSLSQAAATGGDEDLSRDA